MNKEITLFFIFLLNMSRINDTWRVDQHNGVYAGVKCEHGAPKSEIHQSHLDPLCNENKVIFTNRGNCQTLGAFAHYKTKLIHDIHILPSRLQWVWIQSESLSPSSSLLCSAYNCLANLACSSTPNQNTVVYPVVRVCVHVCVNYVQLNGQRSHNQPLKDNSSVSVYIIMCVYECVWVCVCETSVGSGRATFPVKYQSVACWDRI